jgi:hypothetical protein
VTIHSHEIGTYIPTPFSNHKQIYVFGDKILSMAFCYPLSPYLKGMLKDKVWSPNPRTEEEIKECVGGCSVLNFTRRTVTCIARVC